ncbi:hypothetical protein CE91St62_21250 [Lachnospiraceae bacterium]|nr:hypothetical protein CE91St61_21350 [Lachnospiraceae bacterium]BDF38064.1 hypothetical protein CE91St62_21250 [Lachnospiraceae bacterium]
MNRPGETWPGDAIFMPAQKVSTAISVHADRQKRSKRNFPRYNLALGIPVAKKLLKSPASSSEWTTAPERMPAPTGMMNTVHSVKKPSKANFWVNPERTER